MRNRYRPSAGHLMIELLYGEHDSINRDGDSVTINISSMSQNLHIRPVRLLECLEWLRSQLMITGLQIGRYEATMSIRSPKGFMPDNRPTEHTTTAPKGWLG